MPLKFSTLLLMLFGFLVQAKANYIKGTITDEKKLPLPGVWIGIENTEFRAISDRDGHFEFKVPAGNYILHFRCIGYDPYQDVVKLDSKEVSITVVLKENINELNSLMISADRSDFAKYLMEKAKERYINNQKNDSTLVLQGYQKCSVQGEQTIPKGDDEQIDSTKMEAEKELDIDVDTTKWEKWWRKRFPRLYHRKDSINNAKLNSAAYKFLKDSIPEFKQRHLSEFQSEHQFDLQLHHHEIVNADKTYTPYRPYFERAGFTIGVDYGDNVIYNDRDTYSDPSIYQAHDALEEFDILSHNLQVDGVSQKLITSPFSDLGHTTYQYNIDGYEEKKGGNVYCIQIQPKFKKEALIDGFIWIQDSTFRIEKISYQFTPRALTFYEKFQFTQEYGDWNNSQYPLKRIVEYDIVQENDTLHGKTILTFDSPKRIHRSQGLKGNGIQTYAENSDKKDEDYWNVVRPTPLDSLEKDYLHFCDSVQKKYLSPRYLEIRDSLYNHITFWDLTTNGLGFQNSFKKTSAFIDPFIANFNLIGTGGFRFKTSGSFRKEFESGRYFSIKPSINYGVSNNDLRGSLGVGIGYSPNKFMFTNVRVEDDYDRLNLTPSFSSFFSRSNYVRSRGIELEHSMQIIPALFGRVNISYSQKIPILGMQLESWTKSLYGELNAPLDFQTYSRLDLNFRFEYRIKQKYYSKKGRIYYLPNKNPRVVLEYNQGIPGFFNTTIDYKKIKLSITQDFSLPILGDGFWNAEIGHFISSKKINVGEYFYFRGSDQGMFSNPNISFQLLSAQIKSTHSYLRANYMHHFNGMLTNKIPLLNRTKITEAAGAALFAIPEDGIWHQELYLGAERVLKIKGQLFRLGVYACTADNSFSKATVQYKFGVAFFNTYSKHYNF